MAFPTPSQRLSSPLPPCPFVPGPMIEDLRLFVGRKDELHTLISRMVGVQPVSINVVGERRIGKSSLLYHFFLTWERYVQDRTHYIVHYLSLQNPNFQSRNSFYEEVLKGFQDRTSKDGRGDLTSILKVNSYDHSSFTHAFEQLKQMDVLPILCIDEFESLLKYKDEFNDAFYDHLRSMMNNNLLMLIVASNKNLDEYGNEHSLTSSFFNLGLILTLRELSEGEAVDLVRLPASVVAGEQAALSIVEQRQARQLGGRNPFLLQLACSFLCQARQKGKTFDWAKKQFVVEKDRLSQPKPVRSTSLWLVPFRILFVAFPIWVGKVCKRIGQNVSNISSWIIGILVILGIVLAILSIIHFSDLVDWFKKLQGG